MAENNQESPALRIAECCGNCKHASRPKAPAETHEAYYNVAKTERWCYKYNRHITRETVCDGFELEPKKGGAAACKRAFAFNKKVEEINALRERMRQLGVGHTPYMGYFNDSRRLSVAENRPYIEEWVYITTKYDYCTREYHPCDPYWELSLTWGPKENRTTSFIKEMNKYLDKIKKEKEENSDGLVD